ncbi:MAG: bifunctional indole-3-glycerol phosphate synthase/phosphoribosylanthranilate isomerase [Spirochaetales bacterium]|uniref:N-(5'-phosphoribosyl)anthranilate isomerase n=1 Tax=Candidatus Thalassospirochaeta sargassi TaxID=3119039 RepID=A0AAJ1MJN6_9SPIO|nr:bifunctional indole-3-glycerol phosphate synthase/phosphoribosylanthranilate isomerase [Spirochaetales bacterium]
MQAEDMMDIRAEIARRRAADIQTVGAGQGLNIPEKRMLPLVPFLQSPGVICEVKRCSPSVKNINNLLDPVLLARKYVESGICSISVLTEQNYFSGSLADLINIKTAMPEVAILRKDFLLDPEDVEISFRAGADAFLLIASLLDADMLKRMYDRGIELGMTPVVELHSREDIAKAAAFKPALIGINSRDLRIFRIKPLQPLKIRALIEWDCRIIYESGIKTGYDIDFVKGTGFDAVLVGEAAVRNPEFALALSASFAEKPEADSAGESAELFGFWEKLYGRYRLHSPDASRPLVKICGITNHDDLGRVIDLGADVAGFILAESPRQVSPSFIESCRNFDILKVGVVVLQEGEALPDEIAALLESGALDAIQFHGNELPAEYLKWPGYKAARVKDEEAVIQAAALPGPAVLVDAFSSAAYGGTGKRIEDELVRKVSSQQTLWLAGGITPDNVRGLIDDYSPELIDISSGVESRPGIKDQNKLAKLFGGING